MREVKNYQESFKGLHEGEQYIDSIMDKDISFVIAMGGIGTKELVEEKMDLTKKKKEEMDKQNLSEDYKIGFLIGMKNSMIRKIDEAKEEDREIIQEIAELLLEAFTDSKEEIKPVNSEVSRSNIDSKKITISRKNSNSTGLSNEMREKIDEAVRLMETGISRDAISFAVGLSKYDVEQIYKIYHPEQKDEVKLTTNRKFK